MLRELLLIACVPLCLSYPSLYIKPPYNDDQFKSVPLPATTPGCSDQPDKAYGPHGAPMQDTATTVKVVQQGGPEVTSLCLGKAYDLKFTFPTARYALLTASSGILQPSKPFFNDTACSGKRYLVGQPKSNTFTTVHFVPCNTTAKSVTVKLTSAEGAKANYMTWSANLTIASCGSGTCVDTAPVYPPPTATTNTTNSTKPSGKSGAVAGKQAFGFLAVLVGSMVALVSFL